MKKQLEKPFEYLRRKDGSVFSQDTINKWYEARAYVLHKLKNVAIGPGSSEHLHVVVEGDSPLMLSVIRQVAMSAHYINYDETHRRNRTVITIVSKNGQLMEQLMREEYLCNLPKYCKYSLYGAEPVNADTYIDIELQIVDAWPKDDKDGLVVEMREEEVKTVLKSLKEEEIYSIDTRKAVLAGRMYNLGTLIDNLPDEDIHCANRYVMALDVFQHRLLRKPMEPLVNENRWKSDLTAVKNGLSNVFCTDCFESRAIGMKTMGEWEESNEALSKSEHARWVVEKLVMGFRPITESERIHDERLFGAPKYQYRNQLKKNSSDPTHIDLCSYATLRRINPESMKYDSFLMLAIPRILKETGRR